MGAIIGAIRKLVHWFEAMLSWLFLKVWSIVWTLLTWLLETLNVPTTDIFDWEIIEDAAEWFAWADVYVPVIFGMQLIVTYWTFRVTLVPIRLMIRHLPWVGN